MAETAPLSDGDFELARRAVDRGWLTREQVEAAIIRRDGAPGSRLLGHLPLSPAQVVELESAPRPVRPLPPEVELASQDSAKRVGKYVVTSQLGAGGMGLVVKAYDTRLRRWVALKFMKSISDETARRYFEREAQLAAGLSHPNIAAIHEVGEHDGQPFICMQFIEGESLFTARRRMNVAQAVDSVRKVAEALRFAHERRIIHRDLKPSNVMIDLAGQTFVMDFGLAKEQSVGDQSLTGTNVVVGTPQYMAPEQARGKATEQSDLYGVGAILYETLTGRPPFGGESTADVLMQVVSSDPVWPRKLTPSIPPDLEAIVLHALEKEPRRRYASATELIEDLDAFVRGDALRHARRPTFAYVLGRKIRRQPLLWGTAAALVAALAGGAYFGTTQLFRAKRAAEEKLVVEERARRETEAEREKALEREREAVAQKNLADAWTRRAETEAGESRKSLEAANRNLADAILFKAEKALQERNVLDAISYLAATPRSLESPRAQALHFAVPMPAFQFHRTLSGHSDWIRSAAFSPDGVHVATAGGDGLVKLWTTEEGREIRTFKGHVGPVEAVCFSADGALLASGGSDREAMVWNVKTGVRMQALRGHRDSVAAVAFAHTAITLATASGDGDVRLWDAGTGAGLRTLSGHSGRVTDLAFSKSDAWIASGSADGTARLWNASSGEFVRDFHGPGAPIRSVTITEDERTLITAGADRVVRLWEVATGRNTFTHEEQGAAIESVRGAAGASLVLTASADRRVRLWDSHGLRLLQTLDARGAARPGFPVAFSLKGDLLATGLGDGSVRLWRVAAGGDRRLLSDPKAAVTSVAYSPDGRSIAASDESGAIWIWDPVSLKSVGSLKIPDGDVCAIAFQPAAHAVLAAGMARGSVQLWDVLRNKVIREFKGHIGAVRALCFASEGRYLATGGSDRVVRLWDPGDGTSVQPLEGHQDEITALAAVPGRRWLVSGSRDGLVLLWDLSGGKILRTYRGHVGPVRALAASPDGNFLATSGDDRTVRLWGLDSVQERAVLFGHSGPVAGLAFSPDGVLLASASADGSVRLWSPAAGQELHALTEHAAGVACVAFAPDGRSLLSGGSDRKVVLRAEFVPDAPEHAERLSGLRFQALDLRPLTREQERETLARLAAPQRLPLTPDPGRAAFWRSIMAIQRDIGGRPSHTPQEAEALLKPLRDWMASHRHHPLAQQAGRDLLRFMRSTGWSLDLPPGWLEVTEASGGAHTILMLKGPEARFLALSVLEEAADARDEPQKRLDRLLAEVNRIRQTQYKPVAAARTVELANGIAILHMLAEQESRPPMLLGRLRYAGLDLQCAVVAEEPEALVKRVLGTLSPQPPGGDGTTGPSSGERFTVMETSHGRIVIELHPEDAPAHVENFRQLVRKGYYDGLIFHRIVPEFVIQGGCPRGDGTGGPGYAIPAEINRWKHIAGALGMARNQDLNSAGSQFYISLGTFENLDRDQKTPFTVFGHVVGGMDVVRRIGKLGDPKTVMGRPFERVVMKSVRLSAKRPPDAPEQGIEKYLARAGDRLLRLDCQGVVNDASAALTMNGSLAEAYFLRGQAAARLDDNAGAIRDLTRAAELGLDDPWLYARRGEAFQSDGKLEAAIDDFTRAIKLDAEHAWALARRGAAFLEKGDLKAARADLDEALRLKPDTKDAFVFVARGRLKLALGDAPGGEGELDRAITLDPRLALAWHARGEARHKRKRYDEAVADFSRALELDPRNSRTYATRGHTLQLKGECDRAILDLTRAVELAPDYSGAYAVRGNARLALSDLVGAVADFSRAITLGQKAAWLYHARGEAYMRKDELDLALADYSRAIQIDPKSDAIWASRGQARRKTGDFDEALADLGKSIELNSGNGSAYAQRGLTRHEMGDAAGATADLDRGIELGCTAAWAYAARAEVRLRLGDADGAIADAGAAIARSRDMADPYRTRAEAHRRKGDGEAALKDLDEAVKLDPRNPAVRRDRAAALLDAGRLAEADSDLGTVLLEFPKDARARALRGEARRRLGRSDAAIADLSRALLENPRDTWTLERRARLRRQLGNFPGAVADFLKILEVEPARSAIRAEAGLARAMAGEWDGGLAEIGRALQADPADPSGLFALGATHAARGEWARAVEAFRKLRETSAAEAERAELWIWIARMRTERVDAVRSEWPLLADEAALAAPERWSVRVGAYLAGRMTEESFRSVVPARGLEERSARRSSLLFYDGMRALFEDRLARAMEAWRAYLSDPGAEGALLLVAQQELRALLNPK